MDSRPIGVFDSGVGGLSVVQQLRTLLPNEAIVYIADSDNAPFGDKSSEFIEQRCMALAELLITKNVKAIVVACNTATVSSITKLRAKYDLPIVGVEPGVKPAVKNSQTGVVGVLATTQTVSSDNFIRLVAQFEPKAKIILQPCPGLMEQVESLAFDNIKTEALVNKYLQPLLAAGADNIVLGCTHYMFLINLIRKIAGSSVQIVNTAEAVANEVARRLGQDELLSNSVATREIELITTGVKSRLDKQVSVLIGL